MTQSALDKLKDILKHVLCDCLCTNVDVDIDNASNNKVTITVTPLKAGEYSSDSNGEAGEPIDSGTEIVTT